VFVDIKIRSGRPVRRKPLLQEVVKPAVAQEFTQRMSLRREVWRLGNDV